MVSSPINSDFIGQDIARVKNIPTTTSELTNDSGYITDSSLTDYLKADTFKPVNWSYLDPIGSESAEKFELGISKSGILGYVLSFSRTLSGGGKLELFADSNGIDVKSVTGRSFLSGGSLKIENAFSGNANKSVIFSAQSLRLNNETTIEYADIVTKDQLPTIPTNYVTTDTVQTITGDKTFANIKASSFVTTGTNPKVSITSDNINLKTSDSDRTTLTGTDITLSNAAHDVKFGAERLVIDKDTDYQYILAYKDIAKVSQIPTDNNQLANGAGYQTASDVSTAVSTAISGQTKETWTFTLADGSTVTKSVVLG